jgi:cytochrome c553
LTKDGEMISMKGLLLIFTSILIIKISCINHAVAQQSETYSTNATMVTLGKTMQELYPLIFSEKKYQDPKNQEMVHRDLQELIKIFEQSSQHFNQRPITYKISYEVMLQHLKDTQIVLDKKNFKKANQMLRAVPTMCAACHTQEGTGQKHFLGLDRSQFDSDYSYADFSFSTRDYGNAIFYYDRFLTRGGLYRSELQTEQSLIRLMIVYAQMNKDLNLAASYLNEYIAFIKEYPSVKNKLLTWVSNIQDAHQKFNTGYHNLDYVNFKTLEQFTQTYLSPSASTQKEEAAVLPYYVILRGMIYRYLNAGKKIPDTEMPFLLYWLAKCDKATNLSDYTAHADMYLKECYINYPNSSWAKACKKEYDSFATLALLRIN